MNRDRLSALLLDAINSEIQSCLNQSLHQRIYLSPAEPHMNSMAPLADMNLKILINSEDIQAPNTQIETIFDRSVQGRLFISGVPGSGKTTLLLQLAKVLLDRCMARPHLPVPILLDVSSWAKKKRSAIDRWILASLQRKYALDRNSAKQFFHSCRAILLFDGLDELEVTEQNRFIQHLNYFLQHDWSGSFIICGGAISEQSSQPTIDIKSSIDLQPLTREQIYAYLLKAGCDQLWNRIKDETHLIKILQRPLYLNITILSGAELDIEQWQQIPNPENQIRYLWNAYIRTGLTRTDRPIATGHRNHPDPQKTLRTLGWLAQKQKTRRISLSQFDRSWLDSSLEKIASTAIFVAIAGSIVGVIFWILFEFKVGLMFGGIFGGLIGIVAGNILDRSSSTVPSFFVTQTTLLTAGFGSLLAGLICGSIAGSLFWSILGQDSGIVYGALFAVNGAFIFAIVTLLTGGFSSSESRLSYLIGQDNPIKFKWLNNLLPYLIVSLPMGTFWLWIMWTLQGRHWQIWQLLLGGTIVGGLFAIAFGGLGAIHQGCIRLILWSKGRIPWNYRQFLTYAKHCLFIQRVSGVTPSDRFIHPLFSQHLVNSFPNIVQSK